MRLLIACLSTALIALPASAGDRSGEEVFTNTCRECHGDGKHNAPVFGNRQQWGKLVREGLNDLVPAALAGLRQMPPKGGNPELSDMEVARAVVYMANAGGGRFAEPTSADVQRWRKKADARRKP
ncbi:MAG: cytochrome c5 family protein [Betaproteobacteria bacterium]|nr:cytochrome c5 family protein [Betaproteobacteria bacterium]